MQLKPTLKSVSLQQSIARDFSGGWNTLDSELNLSSKFATQADNVMVNDNGDLQVRWGTRLFADFTGLLGTIVGIDYFYTYIVAVDSNGKIAAAQADGSVALIWDSTIAATLPGTPAGWGSTARVSFAQFLGDLIVVNGSDKPLRIDPLLNVTYLQDLGTGTNINTPVAKYVIGHGNYLIMAGDAEHPGRLHISATGTSGTWVGDPAPNDAITFDVDKYVLDSSPEIIGLSTFSNKLVVFFSKWIVTIKLGSFSSGTTPVHQPAIADNIASYGAVSHKAIVPTGEALLFLDYSGISSLRGNTLLTDSVQPNDAAPLIAREVQNSIGHMSRDFNQANCFAVYDKRESRFLFFVPLSETAGVDRVVFVGSGKKGSKTLAWTRFTGWNFVSGCVSIEGRVFFASTNKVYRYGSQAEPILSDYEGIPAGPSTTLPANLFLQTDNVDTTSGWTLGPAMTRVGSVVDSTSQPNKATRYSSVVTPLAYVSQNVTLQAGQDYTVSVDARLISGTPANNIISASYHNGTTTVRANVSAVANPYFASGVWSRFQVTFTNMVTGTYAIYLNPAQCVFDICRAQIERGPTMGLYNANTSIADVARPYTLPRPTGAIVSPVVVGGILVPDYGSGRGIDFVLELPYTELRDRMAWKTLHYIHFDTHGASWFDVQVFLDDLKKRQLNIEPFTDGTLFTDSTGWGAYEATPYATMRFYAGDRGAYRQQPADDFPVRMTDNQNLYALQARFRLMKLRLSGTSYSHLRIAAIGLHYTKGSIY